MKQILVQDDSTLMYVNNTILPGFRTATIVCEEIDGEGVKTRDDIVLLTRKEVEGVIGALQEVLRVWDENSLVK